MSDSSNVNSLSSSNPIYPTFTEQTASTHFISDQIIKDSENKSSATAQTYLKAASFATPVLPEPQMMSISEFFTIISKSLKKFREERSDVELADLRNLAAIHEVLYDQTQSLDELNNERNNALNKINSLTKSDLKDLDKILDDITDLISDQQEKIDKINNGRNEEFKEVGNLIRAYDTYIRGIESLGATKQSDGTYLIPSDKIDEFNDLTEDYEDAVDDFNDYWEDRVEDYEDYNNSVDKYNKKVDELNQKLAAFTSKKGLPPFTPLPHLTKVDLSNYPEEVKAPSELKSRDDDDPFVWIRVTIPAPPSKIYEIYWNSPVYISSVPVPQDYANYASIDDPYEFLYTANVAPLDAKIATASEFWNYTNDMLSVLKNDFDDQVTPLLSYKPLFQKILSLIGSESISESQLEVNAEMIDQQNKTKYIEKNSVIDQMAELKTQTVLGSEVILELIKDSSLNLNDQKIQQLTDKLISFSIGLIYTDSLEALIPSLDLISEILPSLNPNSSVFNVLFASTLMNFLQTHLQNPIIGVTIEKLIRSDLNPSISKIKSEKIQAGLKLGVLLIGTKLLESNLGLKDLVSTLVSRYSDVSTPSPFTTNSTPLTFSHSLKGYSEEDAQFLSQVNTSLLRVGVLTPLATLITPQSVDRQILVDTLKAALILSKDRVSLSQADAIAHQAINDTFAEIPLSNPNQFKKTLEFNLKEMGIQTPISDILPFLVIVPSAEKSNLNLSSLKETTLEMDNNHLYDQMNKHILQLLTPQIGTNLALKISNQVTQLLVGLPAISDLDHPLTYKKPYPLTQMIQEQIQIIKKDSDEKFGTLMSNMFKETIEDSTDLSKFLVKIMNPAYLLIYSAYLGNSSMNDLKKNLLI